VRIDLLLRANRRISTYNYENIYDNNIQICHAYWGAAESFDSYVMYDNVPLLGVMIR